MEEQIKRLEKNIGVNPVNILYSETYEDIISYRQKVVEIENNKEDFLYSLAGHRGETLESLKRKNVSDLMNFAERLINEINKNGGHSD